MLSTGRAGLPVRQSPTRNLSNFHPTGSRAGTLVAGRRAIGPIGGNWSGRKWDKLERLQGGVGSLGGRQMAPGESRAPVGAVGPGAAEPPVGLVGPCERKWPRLEAGQARRSKLGGLMDASAPHSTGAGRLRALACAVRSGFGGLVAAGNDRVVVEACGRPRDVPRANSTHKQGSTFGNC